MYEQAKIIDRMYQIMAEGKLRFNAVKLDIGKEVIRQLLTDCRDIYTMEKDI